MFCDRHTFIIAVLFIINVFFNCLIVSYFYLNELYQLYALALVSHRKNCDNNKGNHPKNNSNVNEDAQPKTESQIK